VTPTTSDPITVEVVRHSLIGVAEEMGSIMKRAAFSPMIKERNDRSCAIFSPDLELVAQAEHLPIHLALLMSTVPAAVAALPGGLGPGDISIHNDPYVAGSHLPDFTTVMPIYEGSRLLGYSAVIAHMTDVGGSAGGGIAGVAREIFEEGFRVPPVRLYKGGALDAEVLNLLAANVRIPDNMRGDILAQAAANQAGDRGVRRVAAKYGADQLLRYMADIISYTERRTRAEIARLPDGVFEFEDFVDDDGNSDEPIPIRASVTIEGTELTVDFTGSGEQRQGPVNMALAVLKSAVFFVVRCLIDPTIRTNAGCFRSITVVAPEGTVVNARFPAPVAGGSLETAQRAVDTLLGAFSKAVPEAVTAAGMGGHNSLSFSGQWAADGRPFVMSENVSGGWGARARSDGLDATRAYLFNTPNNPVEVLERESPLLVERVELRTDSGGAGRSRGGQSLVKEYRALGRVRVSILSDRRTHAPWGLFGGQPGAVSQHFLVRDGTRTLLPTKTAVHLEPGDRLIAMTAGGGGYGDPAERDASLIDFDIETGRVSEDAAMRDYPARQP
jgi:N-methylhydantoinase B